MFLLAALSTFTQYDKEDLLKSFDKFPASTGNQWTYERYARLIYTDPDGIPIPDSIREDKMELLVQIENEPYILNDTLETISFVSFDPEHRI